MNFVLDKEIWDIVENMKPRIQEWADYYDDKSMEMI